jgi:hypothetical protein
LDNEVTKGTKGQSASPPPHLRLSAFICGSDISGTPLFLCALVVQFDSKAADNKVTKKQRAKVKSGKVETPLSASVSLSQWMIKDLQKTRLNKVNQGKTR